MRRFTILAEAKADLRTASRYHDTQRPGLGKEFLADYRETIARIISYPLASPVVYKQARKARLNDFRYNVFYFFRGERITVFAVMHQRRHPNSWKNRI